MPAVRVVWAVCVAIEVRVASEVRVAWAVRVAVRSAVLEGTGVIPDGQPPGGAGIISPCPLCALSAFSLTVICT